MFDYLKEVEQIRINWAIADKKRDENRTTPDEIRRYDNISYGPYGEENLLDIYTLKTVNKPMPTIVNTHGGGWVYGSKEVYQFYCMDLAKRGFTVVNINYRLAPESHFPSPLIDLNAALCFIAENAADYYIDTNNIILIGDSAGAQITSNYAAIFTNAKYAALYDIKVPDIKIKALGLNCGCYDTKKMYRRGREPMFAGYIGTNAGDASMKLREMVDVCGHITSDFPPSFIISAKNDFLKLKAKPMYKFLQSKGVEAEVKIYGSRKQKEVAHVFSINISLEEAGVCNDEMTDFFKRYIN